MGKKLTRWYLWKLSTTLILLVMFVYSNLKTIFLVLHLFSYFFFFFFLLLSTFKLLNVMYSKFERLKISGRTFVRLKSEVPGWRDPLQSGSPKFRTFEPLELDGSNFRNG